MMKSLIRWSATLGLLGSTLIGTWFAQMPKVFALPEPEVVKVLQEVPVFTIMTDEGIPLIRTLEDDRNITQVFMSQQDANQFLTQLKEVQPELANQFKVQALPLGQVYRLALSINKEKESLTFAYIPMRSAVDSAKKVLSDNGEQYQGGVPLFVLRDGPENDIVVMEQGDKPVIPFFFEQSDIQALAEQMKKEAPDIAETVKIGVVTLEGVINVLQTDDQEMLKNIILVPSDESKKFLQNIFQSQQNQGQ